MSIMGICRRVVSGLLFLGAVLFGTATSGWADTQDVKLGILFSITGPYANISPPLLDAAKMAVDEVNNNGGLLNGRKLQTIIADTKGTPDGATAAATKLVKQDNVAAIIGATTSTTTLAAAHNVTIPNGVLMISPSATATVLTSLEDNDFVFRVAPSDADQGWVLAGLVHAKGFRRVAVTYVATAYGSGINDTFRNNFQNYKGTITAALPHEANKNSYATELKQLTKYDPEALVVIDFAHAGGITLVKDALANGHFKQLIGTNSLMDQDLITEIGADKLKGMFFTAPSIDDSTSAAQKFVQLYKAAFNNRTGHELFAAQAYDAVMLTALAIQKAGTTDRTKIRDALREICCSPGEVIEPGEWAKATAAIAAGKKINYEGASGHCDFDSYGNVRGVYRHYEIENGTFKPLELLKP